MREHFAKGTTMFLDLLTPKDYDRFSQNPSSLSEIVAALPSQGDCWVIIDEVQKVPQLLDMVHLEIEAHSRSQMGVTTERPSRRRLFFALTGSSARKLKRGRANMLAGRAFLRHLYPLVSSEFGDAFNLGFVLQWGSLPGIVTASSDEERNELLMAYIHTYLKEEILAEQLAREAPPFRRFLECAAQTNGEIVNFSSIARDVGLSSNTVLSYFQILEDTLLAYRLQPYHQSIRKRERRGPKFYLFDCGVARALLGLQNQPLLSNNYGYGRTFEHFIFLEIYRLASYAGSDFQLSYLQTKDGLEIDLLIERPGMPLALIEIKSTGTVQDVHLRGLRSVKKDFPDAQQMILSQEPRPRLVDGIHIMPWQMGIRELGFDKKTR